jgi:serine protease Do
MKITLDKIILLLCLILITMFVLSSCTPGQTTPGTSKVEIETVMQKVYPALVRIFVVTADHQMGREIKGMAAGSGVIISPDGYVVTNHHVIGHATKIWCTLHDRQRVDAVRVGTDAMADIAVLKLIPESMRKPVDKFAFAEWGDSSKLEVGQKVFAMGSPGAITQSVTYGVIANPSATLPGGGGMNLDGEPVGNLVKWILHDAQIYGGNSGGPLVNVRGRIIGINEIGVAALGGAIPANTARTIADELIKNSEIKRSWIGVRIQRLLRSGKKDRGVLVGGVIPDSPAEKAGLEPGDRILKVNGAPVEARYAEQIPDYHRIVLSLPIGSAVTLEVKRGDATREFKLKTVARGKSKGDDVEIRSWGIAARDITKLTALGMRYPDTNGVLVSSIRPGGPAGQAKPKLSGGDIVQAVGGKKVNNIKQLLEVSRKITAGKDEGVPTIIEFWRRSEIFATVVEIGPEQEPHIVPEVRKAWFAASVQVLTTPLAKAMNLKGTKGVRITRLYKQLEKTDFKVGDIITHLDLMAIDAYEPQHAERFPAMIRRYKPGTEVSFRIIREGKKSKIKYKLPEAPKPSRELTRHKDKRLDLEARNLGAMDKINQRLPADQEGVLLEKVTRGGWAHLGKLRANDIVLGINGTRIRKLEDFKKAISTAEKNKSRFIVFFIKRNNNTLYAEVEQDTTDKNE